MWEGDVAVGASRMNECVGRETCVQCGKADICYGKGTWDGYTIKHCKSIAIVVEIIQMKIMRPL